MRKRRLTLILLVGIAAGCAGYTEMKKMDLFGEVTRAYGEAIAWSDFDSASMFLTEKEKKPHWEELGTLRNVKVASYQVKRVIPSEDPSEMLQLVEIRYFKAETPVVRSLIDRQRWKYDATTGSWSLESGLPAFQ